MSEEKVNPPLWKLGIGRGRVLHFPIILPEQEETVGRCVADEVLPENVNKPINPEDEDTSIFEDVIEEDIISAKSSSMRPVENYEDLDDLLKEFNSGANGIKDFRLIATLEEYPRYNVLSDEEEASTSAAAKNVTEKKKKKSINLNIPAAHKSGYNPPRGSRCSIHLHKKQKLISGELISCKSTHYLFKEILSEKYTRDGAFKSPINPLPFILNTATAFFDLVVITCNGPEDFFVRIGNLDWRKLFKCLQYQMKVWYTSQLDIVKEFNIEEIQYQNYYVYYDEDIQEFVRCQVSEPVIVYQEENPDQTVRVALIDYGGHEYIYFKNILRLMPYFRQFPRMALRGILSLSKILEYYTDVQRVAFQNVMEYSGGVAEALIARGNEEEFQEIDGGSFPVIELIVFVMENGKRKNVDEILLAGESVHSLNLNHSDDEEIPSNDS